MHMNFTETFAHHVPAEQNFTHHTLMGIIVLSAVVIIITGIFIAHGRRKSTATDKTEEK